MYATLRGTGKLGNARLVDKVQLIRCKQSPYLNYGNATVQEHDLGTLRMLKSNKSARKMQSLMHETLSLMDRPDKIHLVDYSKVRDDCQKLSNEGIQENHQRQERNGSIGMANVKIKRNMMAYRVFGGRMKFRVFEISFFFKFRFQTDFWPFFMFLGIFQTPCRPTKQAPTE